jgi:hypothetical protein
MVTAAAIRLAAADAVKLAGRRVGPGSRIPRRARGGRCPGPLGIACYGFTPLALPPGYEHSAMFHGVDERVPVSALRFGVRFMGRLLASGTERSPAGDQVIRTRGSSSV